MHTITLSYVEDDTREKIMVFVENFLSEKVEVSDIEDIKDLLLIEEAKKENLPNMSFESVLKEFSCED